jgi:hypothetical protein
MVTQKGALLHPLVITNSPAEELKTFENLENAGRCRFSVNGVLPMDAT